MSANSLLTRIGALYHDIGKSAAPEHFVENQLGKNPHDRLKPVQSAKIISHGLRQKLAREMGLPSGSSTLSRSPTARGRCISF